jgi:3-keto-5-aminohexanoate cleavage enzyme
MARTRFEYDWAAIGDIGMYKFSKEEEAAWPQQKLHKKWNIPEKIAIQVAISGGGARITPQQNPHHPGHNLDTILRSTEEVLDLEEGPSSVHFDHVPEVCHTEAGQEFSFGDSYAYVVEPLVKKYGWEKLSCHINCLRGTFEDSMKPVVNGMCEQTYVHPRAAENWSKVLIPILRENGVRYEIACHVNSELDLADRLFLRTGLAPNPNMWAILFGLPVKGPRWYFEYVPNEMAMCQALMNEVYRIRELDPDAKIQVCQGARASRHIVILAAMLGLNIRVGHEDTVFKFPHKDEPLMSNAEEVKWAIDTCRALGREVMTPNEYREYIGVEKRSGNDPYAYAGVPLDTEQRKR